MLYIKSQHRLTEISQCNVRFIFSQMHFKLRIMFFKILTNLNSNTMTVQFGKTFSRPLSCVKLSEFHDHFTTFSSPLIFVRACF